MRLLLACLFAVVMSISGATAQPAPPGCPTPGPGCVAVQAFTPVPNGLTSPIAVTSSSSATLLTGAANGLNAAILNTGSKTAYVKLGGSSVTAATTDVPVTAGTVVTLPLGTSTYIGAITSGSDTTTLSVTVGYGVQSNSTSSSTGAGGGGATTALTSTNLSSTISVTNTFQSIQNSTSTRKGCIIQNNSSGTNNQWVYFGAIGSATKAAAVLLSPGGSVSCGLPSGVLTDQISIAGTAGDSFYAAVQ